MSQDNSIEAEPLNRGVSHLSQLMLRHRDMRLILDSFNLAATFELANNTPKIDDRTGAKIDIFRRRLESLFCHQNFTK